MVLCDCIIIIGYANQSSQKVLDNVWFLDMQAATDVTNAWEDRVPSAPHLCILLVCELCRPVCWTSSYIHVIS